MSFVLCHELLTMPPWQGKYFKIYFIFLYNIQYQIQVLFQINRKLNENYPDPGTYIQCL